MTGLEFILKERNIQNKELAEKLGINRQNINNWTSNKKKIPEKYFSQMKDILGISSEYFQKNLDTIDKYRIKECILKQSRKDYLENERKRLYQSTELVEIEKSIVEENVDKSCITEEFYYNDYQDEIIVNDIYLKKINLMNKIDNTLNITTMNKEDIYNLSRIDKSISYRCDLYELFIKSLENTNVEKLNLLLKAFLKSEGIKLGFGYDDKMERLIEEIRVKISE